MSPKSQSTPKTFRSSGPFFVITIIVLLILCAIGLLCLSKLLTPPSLPTPSTSSAAISVNLTNPTETLQLFKLDNGTAIFSTRITNPDTQNLNRFVHNLYVADAALSKSTTKRVFSLTSDTYEPTRIERLGSKHHDYFILQSEGLDGDFAIFTAAGQLITTSVRQSNPALKNWFVAFDSYDFDRQLITAQLFTIANTSATVAIYPETGLIVPDSLHLSQP